MLSIANFLSMEMALKKIATHHDNSGSKRSHNKNSTALTTTTHTDHVEQKQKIQRNSSSNVFVKNEIHIDNNTSNHPPHQCLPWNDETDTWWEMHPDWEVTSEHNDTLCFTPMKDFEKASYFKTLHSIQYNASNCDGVVTKIMWSSGYGADFFNVADGLAHAVESGKPFQITMKEGEKWHYAAFKEHLRNGREPVCASADMFCYFLPIGICQPSKDPINKVIAEDYGNFSSHESWLREYATRPQQWRRRRVLDYIAKDASNMLVEKVKEGEGEESECAAIHIRRTDVVLHGAQARKYFAVEYYLKELKEHNLTHIKDILLFTDDANAIDEALEFHPEYNWMYLKKKRHRGSEGGWENQIPGDSPAEEMVAVQAIFRLAQQCNVLVHTESGFSNVIYNSMIGTGRPILRLRPDDKKSIEVHSASNNATEEQLKGVLEDMKKIRSRVGV